jgi:hypothetical protein
MGFQTKAFDFSLHLTGNQEIRYPEISKSFPERQ